MYIYIYIYIYIHLSFSLSLSIHAFIHNIDILYVSTCTCTVHVYLYKLQIHMAAAPTPTPALTFLSKTYFICFAFVCSFYTHTCLQFVFQNIVLLHLFKQLPYNYQSCGGLPLLRRRRPSGEPIFAADPGSLVWLLRKGTNGVSTNGVTAIFMFFPKSARAYFFPNSVKIHYFCSGPISIGIMCPQPSLDPHGLGTGRTVPQLRPPSRTTKLSQVIAEFGSEPLAPAVRVYIYIYICVSISLSLSVYIYIYMYIHYIYIIHT